MKLGDQLRFVRQNMKKNKTRLFMTVLATAMGCAFLIVLASVGFGLQKSIVDRVVGDRLVTGISIYGGGAGPNGQSGITDEDIAFFQSIPNVNAVTYRNYVQQGLDPAVDGEAASYSGTLLVDFEAEQRAGFKLSAGRMPNAGNEVVVGYHIRQETGPDGLDASEWKDPKEWLNKEMTLDVEYYADGARQVDRQTVVVVGISAEPTREWNRDKYVYVGLDVVRQIEARTGTQNGAMPYFEETPTPEQIERALAELPQPGDVQRYDSVEVIAYKASQVKDISEAIREQGYMSHSIADELEQINMLFMIMKIGLIFVGTIAVLIASIGIFNTMTMAVTERAQEIGIMKAIGAHPSVIRKVFLLESAIIGLLGAVVGTVVAYVISLLVNAGLPLLLTTLMNEQLPEGFKFSVIPASLAILSCAISLGVAVLSGYRPAKRATQIDVLRAMRRDM